MAEDSFDIVLGVTQEMGAEAEAELTRWKEAGLLSPAVERRFDALLRARDLREQGQEASLPDGAPDTSDAIARARAAVDRLAGLGTAEAAPTDSIQTPREQELLRRLQGR